MHQTLFFDPPYPPLKGRRQKPLKVPLFKGDLGGSKTFLLSTRGLLKHSLTVHSGNY
jgi:hypothetical protein